MNKQENAKKKETTGFFTDEMHKNIFTFQEGLNPKYTSKGGKILDPLSTRTGLVRGGRKTSIK